MNPFRLNYKKTEDKVTSLLIHVLKQCGLVSEFIQELQWDSGIVLFGKYNFRSGLQLHNDFNLPVKHAFVLGISNTGELYEDPLPTQNKEGHPDAFFYDEQHQIIILVEVKVGLGKLYRSQINSHKSKIKCVSNWSEGFISWKSIKDLLKNKLSSSFNSQPLHSYILNNFIGVLNEEVIGEYDEDYFIWIAEDNAELIKNLLLFLRECHPSYNYHLPKGNHNEVQVKLNSTRVFTFVLHQSRIILHFGGTRGYDWRIKINREYGIFYDQGDKYQDELSFPFDSIDPNTLMLKSTSGRDDIQPVSINDFIHKSFIENPKIKKLISNQ